MDRSPQTGTRSSKQHAKPSETLPTYSSPKALGARAGAGSSIQSGFKGETPSEDEINEAVQERLREACDSHHDVIYTSCAQNIVCVSSNDGAYFDEFGGEGAVTDGAINWSLLAYCALRTDVQEHMQSDVDALIEELTKEPDEEAESA